jgi:hypothetical protein
MKPYTPAGSRFDRIHGLNGRRRTRCVFAARTFPLFQKGERKIFLKKSKKGLEICREWCYNHIVNFEAAHPAALKEDLGA